MHLSLLRLSVLVSALAVLVPAPGLRAQERDSGIQHLYILNFNSWGELMSPGERDLAIEQLGQFRDIERIVIFSYGWGHDGEASYSDYRAMMREMEGNLPEGYQQPRVAVIGIGWDSSQTGFRKLFNAIIPLPGIANALAWPLDTILFPISFWSKAAQADRIGFGGLRQTLNEIFAVYEGADPHPEIYLIGHSFGTRIISGLMKDSLGPVEVGSVPFNAAPHVKGAVLYQPALVGGNLDLAAEYPILITMSMHDHAMGFLYPIANVPLNAFGFSLFEALVQRSLLVPVQRGVETTTSTVTGVVTGPLRRPPQEAEPDEVAPEGPLEESTMQRTVRKGRRTLGEVIALPLNLVFTLVMLPIDYTYIQVRGLVTHPVDHVMDTLAQLPIVEIPVDGLGKLVGKEVPWGRRSKGFLTLGSIHDGLGRMATPLVFGEPIPIYSPDQLNDLEGMPSGVFVIDASDIITEGSFGADLSNPLADYTLGWIDPLGAHSDYTDPESIALAAWLASGGRTKIEAIE